MIRFCYHPTPNPAKIALFIEETGLPYEVIPVDPNKGEQHTLASRAINPKDHPFKKVNDEETRRALFPSNYPLAA